MSSRVVQLLEPATGYSRVFSATMRHELDVAQIGVLAQPPDLLGEARHCGVCLAVGVGRTVGHGFDASHPPK
jgi:hypothetical protein